MIKYDKLFTINVIVVIFMFMFYNNLYADLYPRSYLELCENKFNGICGESKSSNVVIELKDLQKINKEINKKIKYVKDIKQYNKEDHWQNGLITGKGDCEDYVIAKMEYLENLGFSYDNMKMVIGKNKNLPEEHMILVVKLNEIEYILDSNFNEIVKFVDNKEFIPEITQQYSLGSWKNINSE
jgi:predicted transglutaminase-like cysteine proteinase